MKKYYAESELIINPDGSIFHLHIKPEQLANKIILVGDPGRVALVASHFDTKECEIESREFKTITGTYKGKRLTVVSTGIGCDNIDIVMNELDALANIDFNTRYEKDHLRQLELVRIGTCGGLQPYTPVGTYICSEKSIGFDGNSLCDGKKASSEKMLHIEFYKQRPDVNYIIHVHSPYLSSFACCHIPLDEPVMAENVFYFGQIPLAQYGLPSSMDLVEKTAKYFKDYDAVLMANHGFIVGDKTIKDAFLKLELAESYAQVVFNTKMMGGAVLFNQNQVDEINSLKK